jgi:hypothetical protein
VSYFNKLNKKKSIGFIAHEVQDEFPYLVEGDKDANTNQSLDYIGLIGILVKEIQQLKREVKILQQK